MMKKILFVMLALLIVVPATTSFSATFNYAALWSENRYDESTKTSQYGMLADTGVSTNAYDVYMYVPSWTGNEYQKLTFYNYLGSYSASKFFTAADGYPPPGDSYESRDVYFFIDENGSGNKDSSEPSVYRYYQPGLFSQLPLVTNVKTYYSGSDVMVSWDGIPLGGNFGDDANDQYRVRIIDKATTEYYFDSGMIAINSSNKYVYNLGNLSAYGDNIWIAVEAREAIPSQGIGLANRSRYYAELNLNSFSYAALWSENRYYESTKTSQYGMLADTGVSTGDYDVFMYIPSWSGNEYQKLTTYYNLGAYGAGKFFTTANGYPPPGGSYESRDVYFFIDENGSGSIDSAEPSVYRYYQPGLFSQLPLVTNVKTYYSGSDVMVSWDGVPLAGDFGDDANDQYRVRIIDKATTDIVFDSGMIAINSSNKYVYNLGNLSAYGDNIWIAVEAREAIPSQGIGLANRSRYYAELNSKPKSQVMPGIPLLLLDD